MRGDLKMFCNKSVNEEWDIIEFLLNKIIE